MDERLAAYVHVPSWLPSERRDAFRERAIRAFSRWVATRGWGALTPKARRRILGGLATAFKFDRLDPRWGRTMLAWRGARARLRGIAMAGEQRRAYFADLGRRGGRRSAANRRLAGAHPHVRRVLRSCQQSRSDWMAL